MAFVVEQITSAPAEGVEEMARAAAAKARNVKAVRLRTEKLSILKFDVSLVIVKGENLEVTSNK